MKRYRNHELAVGNFTTTAETKRWSCVENYTEAKIRIGHERDQLTQEHVKALQECGVQPLTQYSTVGATTLQGEIMIVLCYIYGILISDSACSVLVVIHMEAYRRVN